MTEDMQPNSTSSNKTRTAAITGASRGIGLEIARALREEFGSLALIAGNESSFDDVRDEFPGNVRFYGANLSSSDELRTLAAKLADNHPKIDVLVNNAGTYHEGPFSDLEEEHLDSMVDVNLRAPIMLARMLLDQIKAGENSLVINMSSVQASRPSAGLASYAATKGALSAFSKALRKELNPLGIRVTTIEPSGVNTWNDPDPKHLLDPKDVAEVVRMIVTQDPAVQINEVSMSAI